MKSFKEQLEEDWGNPEIYQDFVSDGKNKIF
jgi:hypothetical protein